MLGQIPIVMSIMEGGESGVPVAADENTITGEAFLDLARQVVESVEEVNLTAKRVRVTKG